MKDFLTNGLKKGLKKALDTVVAWERSREDKILMALDAERWRYGLDIIKAGGGKHGTIYPILKELVDGGYVASRYAQGTGGIGSLPRRQYRLTQLGKNRVASLRSS